MDSNGLYIPRVRSSDELEKKENLVENPVISETTENHNVLMNIDEKKEEPKKPTNSNFQVITEEEANNENAEPKSNSNRIVFDVDAFIKDYHENKDLSIKKFLSEEIINKYDNSVENNKVEEQNVEDDNIEDEDVEVESENVETNQQLDKQAPFTPIPQNDNFYVYRTNEESNAHKVKNKLMNSRDAKVLNAYTTTHSNSGAANANDLNQFKSFHNEKEFDQIYDNWSETPDVNAIHLLAPSSATTVPFPKSGFTLIVKTIPYPQLIEIYRNYMQLMEIDSEMDYSDVLISILGILYRYGVTKVSYAPHVKPSFAQFIRKLNADEMEIFFYAVLLVSVTDSYSLNLQCKSCKKNFTKDIFLKDIFMCFDKKYYKDKDLNDLINFHKTNTVTNDEYFSSVEDLSKSIDWAKNKEIIFYSKSSFQSIHVKSPSVYDILMTIKNFHLLIGVEETEQFHDESIIKIDEIDEDDEEENESELPQRIYESTQRFRTFLIAYWFPRLFEYRQILRKYEAKESQSAQLLQQKKYLSMIRKYSSIFQIGTTFVDPQRKTTADGKTKLTNMLRMRNIGKKGKEIQLFNDILLKNLSKELTEFFIIMEENLLPVFKNDEDGNSPLHIYSHFVSDASNVEFCFNAECTNEDCNHLKETGNKHSSQYRTNIAELLFFMLSRRMKHFAEM